MFIEGHTNATAEYIFPNQMEDAQKVVGMLYKDGIHVVIVDKKTQVGATGFIFGVAILLTTHSDDTFVVNPNNVRIITGMSNTRWENDMIDRAPGCFKDKIFHHGKLSRAELRNMSNSLIIIDEIDSGDGERQILHNTLNEAGVLDVKNMIENNNKFILISATSIHERFDVSRWGKLHKHYKMTIPTSYISHTDFLERGIIKEFYTINTQQAAEKWIQEDIIDYYREPCMCNKCNREKNLAKQDFRVHIIRLNNKNASIVQNACIRKGIAFRNYTSKTCEQILPDELSEIFNSTKTNHIVLGVKGFFRRANYIPNRWKLCIGAMHEHCTKKVDNNVQIQGLVGRMTGYWREDIEGGHKTGPYRTSVEAIKQYEKVYLDPLGPNTYQSAGFKMKNGNVIAQPTMLSPHNIKNLEPVDLPIVTTGEFERGHSIFNTQDENEIYAKSHGAKVSLPPYKKDTKGFKVCSTTELKVHSLEEILKFTTSKVGSNMDKKLSDLKVGEYTHRRYVCYRDISDKSTECFVTIWVKRIKAPTHNES